MLSTIVKNVASGWVGQFANIFLSFFIAPITVSALGSVYYGIWTLLMQFTGYLWLADFGVRESVVKYVAQYHASGQKDQLVSTVRTAVSIYGVVTLVAMLAVSALTIALPYAFNIPPDAVTSARIAAFITGSTIAQSFVFNVFVGVVMGLQVSYRLTPVSLIFSLARTGLVYVLLTNGYGIVALAMVQGLMSLAYSLIVFRLCRTELPYLTIRLIVPRREDAMRLINYGKYVLVNNIGEKLIFSTDSLVIAAFQPISALTFYAIGGSLIEYLRTFIYTMGTVVNPVASGLEARKDMARLGALVIAGTKAAVVIGLPICIGFIILGERFITLWMGPAYGPQAGAVLRILAVGFIAGLPFSTISSTLYGLGQHHHVAYCRVAEGVINVTLSVILVQSMGPVGVAIGTTVPQFFSVALYLPSVLPKLMPFDLRRYYTSTYLRPLVAAVPFAVACWGIERVVQPGSLVAFFIIGASSLIVYIVPCWLLALNAAERGRILDAVRQRVWRLPRAAVPPPVVTGSQSLK